MSQPAAGDDTTDPKSLGVRKNTSLQELQHIVQQRERLLGPLIGLGHGPLLGSDGKETGEDVTVLTFDMGIDPPTKFAILKQFIGAAPPPPPAPGATLIAKGQCYVTGALLMLAAFRPA